MFIRILLIIALTESFTLAFAGEVNAGFAKASSSSICHADASNEYLSADYYIDATKGNDANNGSFSAPWKTIRKALSVPRTATVFVYDGNYGLLEQTVASKRTSYLNIRAAPGASPTITGIRLNYPARSAAFLRLIGFNIKPEHRNGGGVVSLAKVTDFELLNSAISTIKYAASTAVPGYSSTFDGIKLIDTKNIVIKSNCITSVFRGIQVSSSKNIFIRHNYISPQAGTAIQYLSNNKNVLIEDNHIRGQSYIPYPEDPDAIRDPHASMVSIRSGSIVIRNNIMHGMGTSSGIMFYLPDSAGGLKAYSNITIEGNLIYDVHNVNVLRMYNLADKIIIRNNLLVSQYRLNAASCDGIGNDARYRYNTALVIHSLADGYDGSGVIIANNIFIGIVSVKRNVSDLNNIIWSYNRNGEFVSNSYSGTSKIITSAYHGCGKHSKYFESDFFDAVPNFMPENGLLLDFRPAKSSDAYNLGDEDSQLKRVLGTLDDRGYFIRKAKNRKAGQHTVGPYELY